MLANHPHIHNTIIFDKKNNKYSNLYKLINKIRTEKYDYVINAQRFFTTGLITALSDGKHKIGFDKNPLSFLFDTIVPHIIDDHGKLEQAMISRKNQKEDSTSPLGDRGASKRSPKDNSSPPIGGRGASRKIQMDDSTLGDRGATGEDQGKDLENSSPSLGGRRATERDKGEYDNILHETHRNLLLIEAITDKSIVKPRLYPSNDDYLRVAKLHPYICIAPASVWYTKQFPGHKWTELINTFPEQNAIYLLGARSDVPLTDEIRKQVLIQNPNSKIQNLSGQLSFLESAALMQKAVMNYVNDSAPLHFASAMNAPVTAIYCSTIPEFGFGPLSDQSFIAEIKYVLYCRPCGLHGYKACPEGHFKCAEIDVPALVKPTSDEIIK